MLNEELVNISKARISHADDCLREAKLLLKAEEYKGAANRAYYAGVSPILCKLQNTM